MLLVTIVTAKYVHFKTVNIQVIKFIENMLICDKKHKLWITLKVYIVQLWSYSIYTQLYILLKPHPLNIPIRPKLWMDNTIMAMSRVSVMGHHTLMWN